MDGGTPTALERRLPGGGEMGARVRAFDWSRTSLGPIASWPDALVAAVRLALDSRYAMFVWWGEDLIQFYNDAYIPILGARHPDALGRPASETWRDIWDTVGVLAATVLREGRGTWSEELLLVMHRHGYPEEAYFTFSYSPVRAADGTVAGVFCAVTEDTRRILGERRLATLGALAQATARVRTVDEVCTLAAGVLDGNRRDLPFAAIYLFDDQGRRARLAAAAGIPPGTRPAPEQIDVADETWPMAAVLARGEMVVLDDAAARFGPLPGGEWDEPTHSVLVLPIAPQRDAPPVGFLVAGVSPLRPLDDEYRTFVELAGTQIATGIANARAYDAERQRAESLAELDRAKTAFFSNASHEFRTPLALMLGPIEDLLRDPATPAIQRAALSTAHRNALRLLKLVNTLLDFSRIEAGRVEAVYEPTDLAALTRDLASVFRAAIERAGLRLVVDVPALGELVWVDRDMWEKIVLNLLSNAFKFTLEGEIAVELRIAGGEVHLRVRDTGIGIPAKEVRHLFERFHRVEGARGRTQEGTGIGLALVQELVRLHGGRVDVESAPGRGTTFTVALLRGHAHLAADRIGAPRTRTSTALGATPFVEEALRWVPTPPDAPAEADDVRATPIDGPRARVLVADDNADMRDYLRRLLADAYDVETVANGEDALAAARRALPDLVLSDVMMPGLDGFGLLRALREDDRMRTVPVILVSARAGEESRVEGLAAGADDYLVKPFSARELVARVHAHAALARLRRAADEAVLRTRDRLLFALEAANMLAWEWDFATDAVLHVGDEARFYGLPAGTRITTARQARANVHPDDRARVRAIVDEAKTGGGVYRFAYRLRRVTSGEWFWVEVVGRVTRAGGAARAYGVIMDVTARTAAEQERERLLRSTERARADAQDANEAKDRFLAVLSHELRSPLNAMLGWIRILKRPGTPADTIAKAVETLERNVWVQAQVISDLLDVSRIVSGKLTLDVERVDLSSIVVGCVESLRPSAEGKGLTVAVAIDAAPVHVMGDAARLEQVVGNIVNNAIKFTPAGGTIDVCVRRVERTAEVVIADTGPGIAPEILPIVFDPFRQADSSASRKHGGLGLGLAIVRLLAERHGGSVSAESAGPGHGATFRVRLPMADVAGREATRAARLFLRDPEEDTEPIDVLLVEDDADTREALALALQDSGAHVRVAESVRGALEAYAEQRPDVLVSDIGMPGDDGYVLIRAIREREEGRTARTLAIAMTGFASARDHETALRAGFDEHVGKPVHPDALVERVRVLAAARGPAPRQYRFSWK